MDAPEVTVDAETMQRLTQHIAELDEAVSGQLPHFRNILGVIHATLKADPAIRTFLEPEQVAVLVHGMELDRDISIAAAMPKEKKPSTKRLTVDDI